jgi:tripartite-type tricarboxylate transporter receptor subunit TctC
VSPEVTSRLVPALERAIASGDVAAKLKPLGILADYAPPDRLLAEMRDEHRRVSEIAVKAGLIAK